MADDGLLTVIRQGLADTLEPVKVAEDMQLSAYLLSDPYPPCAMVVPDETEYHLAFDDGLQRWNLVVLIMVALGFDIGAQQRLDRMLAPEGPLSVKQALEAATDPDQPLEGIVAVNGVTVMRTSGYRTYTLPASGAEALGAEWNLTVVV